MPLYSKMVGGDQLDTDNKEKPQRSVEAASGSSASRAQQLLKEARKETREREIEFKSFGELSQRRSIKGTLKSGPQPLEKNAFRGHAAICKEGVGRKREGGSAWINRPSILRIFFPACHSPREAEEWCRK